MPLERGRLKLLLIGNDLVPVVGKQSREWFIAPTCGVKIVVRLIYQYFRMDCGVSGPCNFRVKTRIGFLQLASNPNRRPRYEQSEYNGESEEYTFNGFFSEMEHRASPYAKCHD